MKRILAFIIMAGIVLALLLGYIPLWVSGVICALILLGMFVGGCIGFGMNGPEIKNFND